MADTASDAAILARVAEIEGYYQSPADNDDVSWLCTQLSAAVEARAKAEADWEAADVGNSIRQETINEQEGEIDRLTQERDAAIEARAKAEAELKALAVPQDWEGIGAKFHRRDDGSYEMSVGHIQIHFSRKAVRMLLAKLGASERSLAAAEEP